MVPIPVVYGTKGFPRKTIVGKSVDCPYCGESHPRVGVKTLRVATLYWIPLIPYGSKYFVGCSNCERGANVEKTEYRAFLDDGILPNKIIEHMEAVTNVADDSSAEAVLQEVSIEHKTTEVENPYIQIRTINEAFQKDKIASIAVLLPLVMLLLNIIIASMFQASFSFGSYISNPIVLLQYAGMFAYLFGIKLAGWGLILYYIWNIPKSVSSILSSLDIFSYMPVVGFITLVRVILIIAACALFITTTIQSILKYNEQKTMM